MKVYKGHVTPGDMNWAATVDDDPLNPRNDLFNHSPDGFSWGYAGSGPAQLALALLCDHIGDDKRALALYQDFKNAVLARIDKDECWELSSDDIELAVSKIEMKFLRDFLVWSQNVGAQAQDSDTLLTIPDRAADLMRRLRIPGNIYDQSNEDQPIETIE
jgi:hypothetical protein